MAALNTLLDQGRAATSRRAVARPFIAAAVLLVLAAIWPMVRAKLTEQFAVESVGFGGRRPLLAEYLSIKYPEFQRAPYANYYVWSCKSPPFDNVTWASPTDSSESFWNRGGTRWVIADASLDLQGYFLEGSGGIPADADRDNHFESIVFHFSSQWNHQQSLFFVIRVKSRTENELVGLVSIEREVLLGKGALASCFWHDSDSDGVFEVTVVEKRRVNNAGSYSVTGATLAEFDWSEPGGVLVPRFMPEDGTIKFWPMPNGKPVSFSSDELVDEVVERVMAEHCEE